MTGTHAARRSLWHEALVRAARRTGVVGGTFVLVALAFVSLRPLMVAPVSSDLLVETHLQQLTRLHDCTSDGLGPGVMPAHAIVRDEGSSSVRLTTFTEGWQMYAGSRPGELVSVCRN